MFCCLGTFLHGAVVGGEQRYCCHIWSSLMENELPFTLSLICWWVLENTPIKECRTENLWQTSQPPWLSTLPSRVLSLHLQSPPVPVASSAAICSSQDGPLVPSWVQELGLFSEPCASHHALRLRTECLQWIISWAHLPEALLMLLPDLLLRAQNTL